MSATNSGSGTFVIGMIIIAVVVALVLLFVYLQRRARARAWSDLASRLGLTFDPQRNPLSEMAMRGDYQGHPLTLDTYTHTTGTGKNRHSTTYTRAVMGVDNPLGLQLELSKEGLLSKVSKRLGAQDIQTGDAELDERLIIRGGPEEAVKRVVTSGALRQQLLSAKTLDLKVQQGEIRYQKTGVEQDYERVRSLLDLLSALATEVERP